MKREILIWETFDQTVLHDLGQAASVKEKRNIFSQALKLNEREWKNGNEKSQILLDAFTQCYNFAQKNKFSVQSTSVLLSILNRVHEYSCSTSFENTLICSNFCQELILSHSVLRPPFSIEVFSPKEAELGYQYITQNYFRHFKLYKYVFTPRIVMDLQFQYPNQPDQIDEQVQNVEDDSTQEQEEDSNKNDQINEIEIENVIKKVLNANLSTLMENFKQQLNETTKTVKQTVTEMTPAPPSPEKKNKK
jgi:hypothetical protein